MPIVDLNAPDLRNRVSRRVRYLFEVAEWFYDNHLNAQDAVLQVDELWRVAEGYFLLSEAFKAVRLLPGNRTEPPKIAAMMAMSIMTFRPFRAVDPNDARLPETVKANQIFAVAVASEVLGQPLRRLTSDQLRRLLRSLDLAEARSLAPYLIDAKLNQIGGPYDIAIEIDVPRIDNFTLVFELLGKRGPIASGMRWARRAARRARDSSVPSD